MKEQTLVCRVRKVRLFAERQRRRAWAEVRAGTGLDGDRRARVELVVEPLAQRMFVEPDRFEFCVHACPVPTKNRDILPENVAVLLSCAARAAGAAFSERPG